MAKQTFTTGQVLTAAQMTSLQQTAMGGGSTTAKTTSYTLVAADAGTVVQMNSASATTITVNTALFAAGDTVQIQNIGAGVCTVTAGTATVNTSATLALSQYDAGSLYFNTTSAAFFFNTDAADGSGGLTLLSTTTISTISTTISSISGSYKNLHIVLRNPICASVNPTISFSPNATNNFYGSWVAAGTASSSTGGTAITDAVTQAGASPQGNITSVLKIFDYANTTSNKAVQWNHNYNDTSFNRGSIVFGYLLSTSAITSLRFDFSAGATAQSGTILIYGEN